MADVDRDGEVTIPGAVGGPGRPVPSERAANAGPVAEDEVTEWLGAAGPVLAGHPPAGSVPAVPGPASPEPWWPGIRLITWTVVAGLVIGALSAVVYRHASQLPGSGSGASRQAAVRDQAAGWVVQQVSRDVTVSCDQVMCASLTAHGFPAGDLLRLGPTSSSPVGSAVVVETPVVEDLFGSSLAMAWAPAVLASFGSGPDRITVRVIAKHGAAAYQVALSAGLAARKAVGAALLRDPRIAVGAAAAGQLAAGLVDSRLLRALTALARHQPIAIAGFGNIGSGASAGVPLRFADLAEDVRGAHLTRTAYVRSARAYLSTVSTTYRPAAVTATAPASGPPVLRIQVTAPSPLG